MKLIKRILLGIGSIIGLLVIGLVGSVVYDFAVGGDRILAVTNTTIPGQDGSPDVRAYLAKPRGDGPFPTVIMIHEFLGLNESIISRADLLAEEGYLVLAPDVFRGSTTSLLPRAIYQVMSTRPENVNVDLDIVQTWLGSQAEVDRKRIAILGFCYGGRVSLAYSLHNNDLAATVIFYGSPETDPEILRSLPGPVLGIFGGADGSIPLEDVRAFKSALDTADIDNQISIYEGQPHAFVRDAEGIKAGGVQGKAWDEMLKFLDVNLKQSSSLDRPGEVSAYLAPFDFKYYLMLAYEHAFGSAGHVH